MPTPVMVNSRGPIPLQAERMGRIEDRLARIDRQIALGERFTEPAEDPAAANRAAILARLDQQLVAHDRVIGRSSARLSLAETALETANEAMVRARDLALQAANGATSDEDRQVIARELEALAEQLLHAANARDDGGRYLFAGASNAQPAYAMDAEGNPVWQGFGKAAGAEGANISAGDPPLGVDLFGSDDSGAFAALTQLAAALAESDPELRSESLAAVVEGLDGSIDRLTLGHARMGADMARLESEANRIASARLDTAEAMSNTKGLDLTAAIAEMQALQLALSASQASFARLYQDSLFDRLG